MTQTVDFVEKLFVGLEGCKEYDILPHVTSEAEDVTGHFIRRSGTALAICSCTLPIFYKDLIRKPLGMLKSGDLLFLVLVNPNTTTFWNYRRRSLLKGDIRPEKELYYTKLILGTHPRSNETLYHRQWIVKTFYSTNYDILLKELNFAVELAHNYRAHYAIWQYRRFLMQLLGSEHLLHDLRTIEAWLVSHPTDSSGWAYVDFLLQSLSTIQLLDSTEARSLLHAQLRTVTKTLEIYPERECLWMFRRRLLAHLWHLGNLTTLTHPITDESGTINRILERVIALFTRRHYGTRSFRSVIAILNCFHSNGLCACPSDLSWCDILQWRHIFFLLRHILDSDWKFVPS